MTTTIIEQSDSLIRFEVGITKDDYQEKLQKEIKNVAKHASIPGFRPGKAPAAMVKKMYGESIRYDVINELVSNHVSDIIEENKLELMIPPIPENENNEVISQEDFTLKFSAPLRPANIDADFSDAPTFTHYEAVITDEDVAKELQRLREAYPQSVDKEVVEEKARIYGDVGELDGDVLKEEGVKNENVNLFISALKEEARAKFIDAPKGGVVTFLPVEDLDDKYTIPYLLGIKSDKIEQYAGIEFSFQIEGIQVDEPAELNQEFFDTIFDEGEITNEEQALARIKEMMSKRQEDNANFLLQVDIMKYLKEQKATKLELAGDLLFAYYLEETIKKHQKETPNEVYDIPEKEPLTRNLTESVYIHRLAEAQDVKVTNEDVFNYALLANRMQFAEMGLPGFGDEFMTNFTRQRLQENPGYAHQIEEAVTESFLAKKLQEVMPLEKKQVTIAELNELTEKWNEEQRKAREAEYGDLEEVEASDDANEVAGEATTEQATNATEE